MKPIRKLIRIWIAIASLLSFLVGWAILAHSPKPVQPVTIQQAGLLNLPPIQAFGSSGNDGGGFNNFPNNSQTAPQSGSGFPMLRTRGS